MSVRVLTPGSLEELSEHVREGCRVRVRGGGTKSGLGDLAAATDLIDTRRLRGVVDYDPAEFTFTARAGTPLAEIVELLGANGQRLPFDPPRVKDGATLGGAIASGIGGARRILYGGVRDFALAVTFVDGESRVVRGGAKVVKNAAGFDLPKLMCGSLGRFGILAEATLKVFPRAEATTSWTWRVDRLASAIDGVVRLASSPLELSGLEIESSEDGWRVHAALEGRESCLLSRRSRVMAWTGEASIRGFSPEPIEIDSDAVWPRLAALECDESRELLVKIPITWDGAIDLAESIAAEGGSIRIGAAVRELWLRWSGSVDSLASLLRDRGLQALRVRGRRGEAGWEILGEEERNPFAVRVASALDGGGRFARASLLATERSLCGDSSPEKPSAS